MAPDKAAAALPEILPILPRSDPAHPVLSFLNRLEILGRQPMGSQQRSDNTKAQRDSIYYFSFLCALVSLCLRVELLFVKILKSRQRFTEDDKHS